MIRMDMHVHTAASFDCLSDPEAVLAAARARHVDVICVTDHNEIDAARALHTRHPESVIVGEEIKTAEGIDIIGLFLHERIDGGMSALETCQRIREQGALVYVPHPFAGGRSRGGRLLPEIEPWIDVLEVFNGRIHDQRLNARALHWASARALAVGAGSDAHTLREVGRSYVELEDFAREPQALRHALGGARIHGHTSSVAVHLASTWARLRKRVRTAS
jgi:predicted metal-dependent phosphoesterase TrpH